MKSVLTYILFFLLSCTAYSQTIFQGQIVDATTNDPVKYASIETTSGVGTFANHKGEFEISLHSTDTITIQSLGYRDTTLFGMKASIIQMQALDYEMKEVIVEAKQEEQQKIFAGVKKRKGIRLIDVQEPYIQHGIYIPYIADSLVINDIFIYNSYSEVPKKFRKVPLRLRIYNVDSLGYPNKDLLKEEKLISFSKKGKNKINLGAYGIQMPKGGIVIALEWIETEAFYMVKGIKNTKITRFGPVIKGHKKKKPHEFAYRWLTYQPKERKWFYNYDYWLSQGLDIENLKSTVPAIGVDFIKM